MRRLWETKLWNIKEKKKKTRIAYTEVIKQQLLSEEKKKKFGVWIWLRTVGYCKAAPMWTRLGNSLAKLGAVCQKLPFILIEIWLSAQGSLFLWSNALKGNMESDTGGRPSVVQKSSIPHTHPDNLQLVSGKHPECSQKITTRKRKNFYICRCSFFV